MSAEEQRTDPTPEELREEIAETREELGDTVEALADKADVKAHAKRKADEVKAEAHRNRTPLIAGGAVLLLVAIWLIRRN